MEVVNNRFAIIYRRTFEPLNKDGKGEINEEENDEVNEGKEVFWIIKYKITKWPSNLSNRTSAPFMFSSNFKYQIDFDSKRKAILILDTET